MFIFIIICKYFLFFSLRNSAVSKGLFFEAIFLYLHRKNMKYITVSISKCMPITAAPYPGICSEYRVNSILGHEILFHKDNRFSSLPSFDRKGNDRPYRCNDQRVG